MKESKQAKATPGPWEARCMGSEGYFVWKSGPINKEHYSLTPVANCANMPFEISKANARLIAAAPETLNALELAVATIERLTMGHPAKIASVQGTLQVAHDAIARATGE